MTETTATASATDTDTATATATATITVVRLDTEGNATRARWSPGPSGSLLEPLQAAVGGDIDVVRLHPEMEMWVHDEGLYACDLNPVASAVAAGMGFVHQPYCGPVVFTGGADEDGNTLGLSDELAEVLMELVERLKANPVRMAAITIRGQHFLAAYR